jgi:beta-fructofuranosidase
LALLYESEDLRHWRYLRPALAGVVGTDCNMWECPVLLRSDHRGALLISPHPEAKRVYWLGGEWRAGALRERCRGKLDWGEYVYAPQCLREENAGAGRSLLWTWVKEGRTPAAQRAAGWSGLLSLPKACRLDEEGGLIVTPAAELAALRMKSRSLEGATLTSVSENPFTGFKGDCLEVEAEFSFPEPTVCDLILRASPDGAECTVITYRSAEGILTVDGSHSSLDPDVDRPTVSGPLRPDDQGVVRFRAFLDRSVLEVFVADRACVTQRLYPTRHDSVGLSFRVREGSVRVQRLSAWKLASIWPDKAREPTVAP